MRPGPLEGDESDEEEGSRSLDPLSQMAAEVEAGGGAVGGGAAGGEMAGGGGEQVVWSEAFAVAVPHGMVAMHVVLLADAAS